MRTFFVAMAIAFAAVLVAPAAAQAYEPTPQTATVSSGSVAPGEAFNFTAGGFAPGSTVRVTVNRDNVRINGVATSSAYLTADSEGRVSASIRIRGDAGRATMTATGTDVNGDAVSVSTTIRVLGQSASSVRDRDDDGTGLARTGTDGTAQTVWAGVALLGAGAALVLFTSVRRRTSALV